MRHTRTALAAAVIPLLGWGVSAVRAEAKLSLDPVVMLEPGSDPAEDAKPTSPPETSAGPTGNWWGARDKLAANHVYMGGYALVDVSKVLRGGIDTESYPVRYLLDLHVTVDADALGLKGGTFYADFQSHDETNNMDREVGDWQGYDNVDGPRYVQFAQLWYKQAIGDLRLKIGKIDANTDAAPAEGTANDAFSLIEHGYEFVHSAPFYAASMYPFSTYPDPGPGLQAFYGKEDGPYVGAGAYYVNRQQTFLLFSGHPEHVELSNGGMFLIGEAGTRWKLGENPGHAGAGLWYHTGEFPRIADPSSVTREVAGAYLFGDQTLYREEKEGSATKDLGIFGIAGYGDPAAVPMDWSYTGGIAASGFIPGRPDDAVGVMASWVHFPDQPGLNHPFELAAEVFYKIQITEWALLKPDFQYIVNPAGVERDAAVVTLRAEIDF